MFRLGYDFNLKKFNTSYKISPRLLKIKSEGRV